MKIINKKIITSIFYYLFFITAMNVIITIKDGDEEGFLMGTLYNEFINNFVVYPTAFVILTIIYVFLEIGKLEVRE